MWPIKVCVQVIGECYWICEESSIKPFVLQRKLLVISSDVTLWLNCIVGNVGARFWKGRRMRVKTEAISLALLRGSFCLNESNIAAKFRVLFKSWRLHYPQRTITRGSISDYMLLSLEALNNLFHNSNITDVIHFHLMWNGLFSPQPSFFFFFFFFTRTSTLCQTPEAPKA